VFIRGHQVIRPDRLATLYFFHPLRRLLRRTPAGIPILMYHSISENPETHKNPYYHTCTSPRVFRQQMEFLSRNGYKTVSLGEAVRKLEVGQPFQAADPLSSGSSGAPLVVLTFDDGFADFYTEAFPALSAFGYAATVFLPTAYIGDTTRKFNGIACLTWSQVRELRQAGVEFGSHTLTHPQLRELSAAGVDRQLRLSKEQIEDRLGTRVASFSYPYAFPASSNPCESVFIRGHQPHLLSVCGERGNRRWASVSCWCCMQYVREWGVSKRGLPGLLEVQEASRPSRLARNRYRHQPC